MALKTIRARAAQGSDDNQVDLLVQKARTQAGVERILVVYEDKTAHIYVEGEPAARPRSSVRIS